MQTWQGSEPGAVLGSGPSRLWLGGAEVQGEWPPWFQMHLKTRLVPHSWPYVGALPGAWGPREMKGTGNICSLTFFLTPTGASHRFPAHSRRIAILQ